MAIIKTTDNEVQLFTGVDPYRYDVDNRPLRNLILNDIAINAQLENTATEVTNARTDNTVSPAVVYASLDSRLESMTESNVNNASVSFALFEALAESNRLFYSSGFLTEPTTRSVAEVSSLGYSGDDWGLLAGTFWQGDDSAYANQMYMNAEYDGLSLPINVMANGWIIKLINLQVNGATAYGDSVAIKLNAPPSSGGRQDLTFLEVWSQEVDASAPVFWLYGGAQFLNAEVAPVLGVNYTDDSLDPRVSYTVTRLPNGNWLQIRHRVRIVNDIDPVDDATGFGGSNANIVLGRGAAATPAVGYSYTNMLADKGDSGLWRSGAGDSQSKTDLETYDGYTYAIPIAMVHRRNTGQFNLNNQNGTKKLDNSGGSITEGTPSTVISGRPDNLHYDEIAAGDFIDMRHWVDFYGVDFERLRERTLTEVLRGTSRLQWEQLAYATTLDVWGNRLLTNDTIFNSGVYNPISNPDLGSNTNYVIDKSVGAAAYSEPDGIRRVFAAALPEQTLELWIDPFGSPASAYSVSHPTFVSVSSNVNERTVTINVSALEASTGTTIPSDVPVWYWSLDYSAITVTVGGTSASRTFTFDTTGHSAPEKVLANIKIQFPDQAGLLKLPTNVARQDYYDALTTSTKTSFSTKPFAADQALYPVQIIEGADGNIWVSEYNGQRFSWWAESPEGLTKVGELDAASSPTNFVGVWATEGFNALTGIAVQGTPLTGAGAVWVADNSNRRVRKYTYNTGTSKWSLALTIGSFTESATSRQFGTSTVGGPYNLAITSDGATLYCSDPANHVVWKFTTATPTVATIIAGVFGAAGNSNTTGALKLNQPHGVSLDPSDAHLWIADTENDRVIKVNSSSGALIVGANNGETSTGTVPKNVSNCDTVLIIGNPVASPSTVKYVVRGNDGNNDTYYPSLVTKSERVYILDNNFNVVKVSTPSWYRSYDIAVDDPVTPTYVFVGRSLSSTSLGTVTERWGVEVLSYSTLTKVAETDTSTSNTVGIVGSLQWVSGNYAIPTPPSGYTVALTGALFVFGNASYTTGLKNPYRLYLINKTVDGTKELRIADNYNASHAVVNGADSDSTWIISQFTKVVSLSAIPTFWQVCSYYNGVTSTSKAWKWTWVAGSVRWERTAQASPAITMAGVLVWGADQDSAGNLYVGDILGNYVYRYKKNGAAMDAPGAVGNNPGTFGTGVAGPAINQIAAPRSINIANDDSQMVIVCNKRSSFFAAAASEINRLLFLTTTTAKWESGAETPYLTDTINNGNILVTVSKPRCVIRLNDNVFITSWDTHLVHKLTASVTGDLKTLQAVGTFGVLNEAKLDHGGVNNPASVVVLGTTSNTERLVISDFSSSRLLRVYTKMAGVSRSSGNIYNMVPLVSNERLRVWYETGSYQGVGSSLFGLSAEPIWNTQIVVAPSSMLVTSLGRSPVDGTEFSDFGGCIDKLPLGGKADGYSAGASEFIATDIDIAGNIVETGTILDLPLTTKRDTSSPQSPLMYVRTDLTSLALTSRGYTAQMETLPSTYSSFRADIAKAPARVCAISFLIKRAGKLYLAIVTEPVSDGAQSNKVGTDYRYTAVDLFEVPGRLLVK